MKQQHKKKSFGPNPRWPTATDRLQAFLLRRHHPSRIN